MRLTRHEERRFRQRRQGQTFRRYRAGGGSRPNVQADFFIGAQASVEGWPLMTRDASRYRSQFPSVVLVGVET
jgi:predicted nucleic acid-binding protein